MSESSETRAGGPSAAVEYETLFDGSLLIEKNKPESEEEVLAGEGGGALGRLVW